MTLSAVSNTAAIDISNIPGNCKGQKISIPYHTFLVRSALLEISSDFDRPGMVRTLASTLSEIKRVSQWPGAGGSWEERTNTTSWMH